MSNFKTVASACFALAFASACTQTSDANKPQTASPAVTSPTASGGEDWAVGTWSGFRIDRGDRRALQAVQGVLTVERSATGSFVCTGKNLETGVTFPITTCVVDGNSMTLASPSAGGFTSRLARTTPNTVSGIVEVTGTALRFDLTLTKK